MVMVGNGKRMNRVAIENGRLIETGGVNAITVVT